MTTRWEIFFARSDFNVKILIFVDPSHYLWKNIPFHIIM